MKSYILGLLAKKAVLAAVVPIGLAALAGGGMAVASHVAAPSGSHAVASGTTAGSDVADDSTEVPATDPADESGDLVARFHGDATTVCNTPDGVTLSGDWTHGDYVSAWSAGDPVAKKAAAHSRCGKPLSAHVKAASEDKAKDDSEHADKAEGNDDEADHATEHRSSHAEHARADKTRGDHGSDDNNDDNDD